MYIADLHIHSRYSMATSRDCDAPHLDLWARRKGIGLVGTGDFTHPAWRRELRECLLPAEEGLYTLKPELRLQEAPAGPAPRFVVSGEISSIYKKKGKTRKVHNLILLPGLDAAEALALRLEMVGNIHSDGRPILGMDSYALLALTLQVCPAAVFIPAHIWTPHFSVFGAFSGFTAMEECFDDLAGEIHAVETGLSSDPAMNRRVSFLDRYTLVSNSDAHSPAKLGREANLIDGELSYPGLARALKTGEGFGGTLEFFPEEGKYHLDGHRACGVCLEPEETLRLGGLCPVCGKKLTIGVEHRVLELADRGEGVPGKPFESLVPLGEVIAASTGASAGGKQTARLYEGLLGELGPELFILREASLSDVKSLAGECVAEGLRRLRAGRVERQPGFDGQYGVVRLFAPGEREAFFGQTSFLAPVKSAEGKKAARTLEKQTAKKKEAAPSAGLNPEQLAAVAAPEPAVAVVAGPGSGKTKTLVARAAHLIRDRGIKPGEITAVTFTNLAAAEMRQRLAGELGTKAVAGMTIGTFHAICLGLLDKRPLLDEAGALDIVEGVLGALGKKEDPKHALRAISQRKNGGPLEDARDEVYEGYLARCRALQVRDLDDLLLDALALEGENPRAFTHLLVDEYQDINALQRKLVDKWSRGGKSLFVIGDPDQSIYGFRGASAACFSQLAADFPVLREVRLNTNYRSTPQIVEAAGTLIAHNPGERTLKAFRPDGKPVALYKAETPFQEGVFIAKEVARLAGGVDMLGARSDGPAYPFSDMAVLCRTHRQLDVIEACLVHDGVPCLVSGRGHYLADPAVREALSFFRALVEDPKGCGEKHPIEYEAFAPIWREETPKRLVERYLVGKHSEALQRLGATAAYYESLPVFLQALALGEEGDLRRAVGEERPSGAVRLMTLHGAKGLEFPVVFLAGAARGILPMERGGQGENPEEERRLFYVGLTRARDVLIVTGSQPLSPFIAELPSKLAVKSVGKTGPKAKQLSLF